MALKHPFLSLSLSPIKYQQYNGYFSSPSSDRTQFSIGLSSRTDAHPSDGHNYYSCKTVGEGQRYVTVLLIRAQFMIDLY